MKRTQLITLLLVLFAGIGVANAKPKVAVLGLEVLDKANAKASIDAARQVTDGLRQGGKAAGPFDVSDAQREFLDEKIINGCESEARDCLTKITTNLGAVALVYGKVQLTDGKKNFQVTVWLLSVEKNSIKSTSSTIATSSSTAELQALGKKLYGDLVGVAPSQGSFAFKTKAKSGTVFLNGEPRGQLEDGEYKSPALADGEYKVRVEADGFKKWEGTARVKGGQVAQLDVKLEPEPPKDPVKPPPDPEDDDKGNRGVIKGGDGDGDKDPYKLDSRENTISKSGSRKGWKIMAISGAVVAGGAMGVWTWQWSEREDKFKAMKARGQYGDSGFFGTNCQLEPAYTAEANKSDMKKACSNVKNMWIAGTVAGAAGAFTLLAIYKGFVAKGDDESPPTANLKRPRKPRFAVTPIVSPDGAGASFRLDF
ncbi:MAG TPA: carboxypeptidase-like regulatory domain-containing protein [Kofleriaceae bacterium]|nr:carboxypeptidase-like regulatory domain-containing protein [Kofleriaceae bacterium]